MIDRWDRLSFYLLYIRINIFPYIMNIIPRF